MKYLIIYLEVEHLLNFLTQNEKGDLLDILIKYAKDEIEPTIQNKNILNVFNFLKSRLDAQFAKVKIKAEVARKNGANGGRPIEKKKPTRTKQEPKITQLVIPNFINLELWNDFVKMRKEMKKPLTETSYKQNIQKLTEFENKKSGNANEALKNAIAGNWQGLFEPKTFQQSKSNSTADTLRSWASKE